jgi:hypothetical protein
MANQTEIISSRIVNRLPHHFTTVIFKVDSSFDIFYDDEFTYEKRLVNKILANTCGRFFYEIKKSQLLLGVEMESDITFLSLVFSKILDEINKR